MNPELTNLRTALSEHDSTQSTVSETSSANRVTTATAHRRKQPRMMQPPEEVFPRAENNEQRGSRGGVNNQSGDSPAARIESQGEFDKCGLKFVILFHVVLRRFTSSRFLWLR